MYEGKDCIVRCKGAGVFFATIKAIFSKNEVIHYHAEGPCAWMWLVKWFTNKKIVATIHGLDWQRAKWGGFGTKYLKFRPF